MLAENPAGVEVVTASMADPDVPIGKGMIGLTIDNRKTSRRIGPAF
jgi:hypothetical protein